MRAKEHPLINEAWVIDQITQLLLILFRATVLCLKRKSRQSELFKKSSLQSKYSGSTLPFPVKHFLLLLFSFYVTLTPCDTMYHGKYNAATSLWTKTKLGNLKKKKK